MKERPILFSAPMVRALLAGAKTQTRRIVKPQPELVPEDKLHGRPAGTCWWPCNAVQSMIDIDEMGVWASPYGRPGDRLWVRETWSMMNRERTTVVLRGHHRTPGEAGDLEVVYRATEPHEHRGWRPSIFMPRWACRIELEVTEVRVEQLRTITEDDCVAEGCAVTDPSPHTCARDVFADLWSKINGVESWDANPWVWVVSFKRARP